MPQTITFMPQGTYAIGQRTAGPIGIPQGIDRLRVSWTASPDPLLVVTLNNLDIRWTNAAQEPWSTDGGGGYDPFPYPPIVLPGGRFNEVTGLREAGLPKLKDGITDRTIVLVELALPRPELPNRQLRLTLNIAGAAWTTKGDVTLMP
jgi:hypothetical protein